MEKKIMEGNAKIAEFMEWFRHESNQNIFWVPNLYPITNENTGDITTHISELRFHSSWDWLMPVCKRIIELYADKRENIFLGLSNCNIEMVWGAVVGFIDFWNDESRPKLRWNNVKFPYDPMPKGKIIEPNLNVSKYQTPISK